MTGFLGVPKYGSANYSIPTPNAGGATDDIGAEAAVPVASTTLGAAGAGTPSTPATSSKTGYLPGMITDYYNRIFIFPAIIDIRNPVIGSPNAYSVWNAYFQTNILETIIEADDTGLTNSAADATSFDALEVKDFAITVGATAPISIDATYTFNFQVGSGILLFQATRATLVPFAPEVPIRQSLEWRTDIIRAYDGTQQRISSRPTPKVGYSYNII